MRIEIIIDAPKGWKRRVLLYVATPVALVAATALVARAMVLPVDPSWIHDGGVVSASSLSTNLSNANSNFTTLDQRLGALEKPVLAVYGVSGGGQAIPSGDTAINFDTKYFDSNGAVQTGSAWQFVCPLSGYYRIESVVTLGSSTWSAGTRVYAYIMLNHVEQDTFNDFVVQSTVGGNLTASGGYVIHCPANQPLQVGVHSAQGATVNGSVDIEMISQ